MKKEKQVKSYQRRTKSGKMVTVKAHTAKYDAAEALKEAAKKKGAGDELEALKKKVKTEKVKAEKPVEDAPDYGFTADDYKAWYHWDQEADPKNKSALKVEKALKKQMGTKAYNKYFDEMSDSYSSRGHNKAFKGLSDALSIGEKKSVSPKSKEHTLISKEVPAKGDPAMWAAEYMAYGESLQRKSKTPSRGSKPSKSKVSKTPYGVSKEEFSKMSAKKQDALFNKMVREKEYTTPSGKSLGPAGRIAAMKKEAAKFRKYYGIDGNGNIKENASKGTTKPSKISDSSLKTKGYVSFKDYGTTLYIGKKGKAVYMKTPKGIVKADRDDYADFVTGHNGLSKANRKKLESLGWHEHEEY